MLDVDCGSRPFDRLFAGRLARTVGCELPGSTYAGGTRLVVEASGEALPFRDVSFDTLLVVSVLDYTGEPALLVREAARMLRPGGARASTWRGHQARRRQRSSRRPRPSRPAVGRAAPHGARTSFCVSTRPPKARRTK